MSLQKTEVKIALQGPDRVIKMTPVKAYKSRTLPVAITARVDLKGNTYPGWHITHIGNGLTICPRTLDRVKDGRAMIEALEQETTPEDWEIYQDHTFNPPLWRFKNKNVEKAIWKLVRKVG